MGSNTEGRSRLWWFLGEKALGPGFVTLRIRWETLRGSQFQHSYLSEGVENEGEKVIHSAQSHTA